MSEPPEGHKWMQSLERVSRRVMSMSTEVTGPGPSKRRAQKGQRSPRAELGGGLLSRALAGAGERWEGVGKGRGNEDREEKSWK